MSKNIEGIIISGVGGLYSVKAASGEVYACRAKGAFRKSGLSPLAGDSVVLRVPELAGEEYFTENPPYECPLNAFASDSFYCF